MATEKDLLYRAKFVDDVTPGVSSMSSVWQKEFKAMEASLQDNIVKLRAQKELLSDPVYQQSAQQAAKLRAEINELTKATLHENEAVQLTSRSRKELIVLMHELSQGRYKNFGGSLMVLEEGNGGIMGAVKAATAMLGGPYVVAAGAAALATAGVSIAFWKAAEAQAEMVHKSELLGQTLGASAEAIRGFQYITVGTNVTTEEMGRVFGIFEKKLGANAEKFRELGITARDPMQAFEQVMDKARGMGDSLERANFLNETLGHGWEKVSPVIMQGSSAMEEAIRAMKIPEDTLRNFERANEAQIQIDKDFKALSVSSGSFFSGFRANAKEFEQSLLDMLTGADAFQREVDRYAHEHGLDKSGPKIDEKKSKEQSDASTAARKELSKANVEAAVAEVHREWDARADAYKEGNEKWKATHWTIGSDPTGEYQRAHDEYTKIMQARDQAEGDVRKSWAKKTPKQKAIESARNKMEEDLNVTRTGMNSVDLNDDRGFNGQHSTAQTDAANAAFEARQNADKYKRFEKLTNDIAHQEEVARKARAKANLAEAKDELKQIEDRKKAWHSYADVAQGYAASEVSSILKGQFSITQAYQAAKDAAIEMIAEKSTKAIEGMIEEAVFGKATAAAQAAVTTAMLAEITAAAAPAATAMSIATMGGADTAAITGMTAAYSTGAALAMAAHANGGFEMGNRMLVGERGPEAVRTVVPTQITQASHTTNNTNASTNHFHFYGATESTIMKVFRNAGMNGKGVSRV